MNTMREQFEAWVSRPENSMSCLGTTRMAMEAAYAAGVAAERERCAKVCIEWARICDSGKRHGAKVGAQECASLIRKGSS